MRHFFIVFVLSFAWFINAQDVGILYDQTGKLTLPQIENQSFKPISSGYSNGLNRGAYWLKISPLEEVSIFQLENNHIKQIEAYTRSEQLKLDRFNGFTSFQLDQAEPTYIKLGVDKEAYFPFSIKIIDDYKRSGIVNHIGMGLFYGFAMVCLLLNLGLFYNSKDFTFLFYCLFLFLILSVMAHRDGMVEILGLPDNIKEITEPLSLSIGGLMCAVFTGKSIKLKKHFPVLVYSYWGLTVLSLFLLTMYFTTQDYLYVVGIYFVCLYIFVSSWISSLLLIRLQSFAIIFCLAYFFMMISAILFYLGPAFDIQLFEVKQGYLKIGALLEMVVITSAILYRLRIMDRRQKKMRKEMTEYLSHIDFLNEELEKNQLGQENVFTRFDLTSRESEVLELIAAGKTNKEIADALFISINTVKYHVKKVYEKLQVSNRKEAYQIVQSAI
ncbi:7TMR-DISM extracellular 2 [Nonlabens sp. Hel1_33_55]|uniref:LuxR C-terminal-related transcriptional regulator n=1 Tax=Nonlabens sp. Hel1_33_55 TaxID=1336802 RepID=UPI000875B4DA|nr:LuxR C-terminal-related transcriptional regulator [Nonlabens sp. Hel1_33_55]SCX97925.1 7TMR-DISM extracellular 2 [Nonlabens sp. Hel1_33_55]